MSRSLPDQWQGEGVVSVGVPIAATTDTSPHPAPQDPAPGAAQQRGGWGSSRLGDCTRDWLGAASTIPFRDSPERLGDIKIAMSLLRCI